MNLLWTIARSSGLIVTLLLSAVIALGILSSADMGSRRWARFVTTGLHRRLAYLTCGVLGIHIAAVVLDNYVDLNVLDAFVPFTSEYARFAVGLGALAVDLLIALVLSSILKAHLPFTMWQMIHVLAYAIWPLAIMHGLLAGTDDWLTLGVSLVGALAVGTVALLRMFNHLDRNRAQAQRRQYSAAATRANPPRQPASAGTGRG